MTLTDRPGVSVRLACPAVAAVAGSVVLGMMLAAPAAADEHKDVQLELSRDGVHYFSGAVQDIFAESRGYVPGESRPGAVWVRNSGSGTALVSLSVTNLDRTVESTLPEHLALRASTATHSAQAGILPTPGHCGTVFEGWTMAGGEALPIQLDLNLDMQAPNSTRNQESNFDLVFLLQDVGGGQRETACTDTSKISDETVSAGRVPVTSGTAAGELLPGAAARSSGALPAQHRPPWHGNELAGLAQSNVVANSRSRWLWLLALSASAYMVISFRRRRKTQ